MVEISAEGSLYLEKINKILEWSAKRPRFNTKFVEDVKDKVFEYGTITDKQREAVDRIIDSFKIKL